MQQVLSSRKTLGILAVITVVGLGIAFFGFSNAVKVIPAPPPVAAPTWHPVEATLVPLSAIPENDVVIPAGAPIKLEIPTISFDSSKLAGEGVSNPIQQWTEAMNLAHQGQATPPEPKSSSLIWDSTVAGGGLFGTDAQSSGRILGHTTFWNRPPISAFNTLVDVRVGDPVAITTENGKLCYTVERSDNTISKDSLNAVYGKETVTEGVVYLITCSRAKDDNTGPTDYNLVLTLQLNQQQTNTGSC